ncbi:HAD family hydrolase [Thalassotalea euphylliae]|uniref:HAD family hydrolase n=1 Tax=Thalassotalea euphylliae TaxID=1655234 RepID=UPI0015F27258|nr:HAD-IIB family hydrolase [Thalassotalea euphylliae]
MSATNPLVVFDLDQTLLNKQSQLSAYTLATLRALDKSGIRYTIATGRSHLSAAPVLKAHQFPLPHIYTNGVLTWCPNEKRFSFNHCLNVEEGLAAVETMSSPQSTPFVSALDEQAQRYIFHGTMKNKAEKNLLQRLSKAEKVSLLPMAACRGNLHVTNISMLGPSVEIHEVNQKIKNEADLIAYSGKALTEEYRWIDVHHSAANKGAAVLNLKHQLGADSVICFGDGDNDTSMFDIADECYAPENAVPKIKAVSTAVIGHHDDDGVAQFLRERFELTV